MTINIAGAGMAGLLAANLLAARRPTIFEVQPSLPNNHSAVLRFRSNVVGEAAGIKFRKVQMIKGVIPWKNPVADALAYSLKSSGTMRSDRSIVTGLTVADRWIAPSNLVARLAAPTASSILFNSACPFDGKVPTISTIPMPALMKLLGYPHDPSIFKATSGTNIRATVENCDAYVSLSIPSLEDKAYRISLTGNELIIELTGEGVGEPDNTKSAILAARECLGIEETALSAIRARKMTYAKILPIDEDVRKDFMFFATDKFNIFSLGRFATWRPGLLMDDLVSDIRKIDGWIDRSARYNTMRSR